MEWTPLDTWIVVVAALCSVACALLGNFLVLRRLSLMGDAISHTVLPGLAGAFLLTGSRGVLPMLAGAVLVGVLTAWLVQAFQRGGRLDEGAAMGVVLTSLFALGLVMIRQAADRVDLDPGCVLYGSLELAPWDRVVVLGHSVPRAAVVNGAMVVINGLFVLFFFKELKLSSFDPAHATAMGVPAGVMHFVTMALVAATCVAAFESVGSILVIAMLIVPAATAHLLADRLWVMIGLSVLLAVMAAVMGHAGAILVPGAFGHGATTTAGMMAVACGLLFLVAAVFSPRSGYLGRLAGRLMLRLRIAREDLLADLWRESEGRYPLENPSSAGHSAGWRAWLVLARWQLAGGGEIRRAGDGRWTLTKRGRRRAGNLIRSHRLWEGYLAEKGGLAPSSVHRPAERLEHFTDPALVARLEQTTGNPPEDPHRRPIPDPQSES
jgi:manganese/zinc/iron transport system permease protein